MKKSVLRGLAAAAVAAATIGLAAPSQAYVVPDGHHLGEYTGHQRELARSATVDMNVSLEAAASTTTSTT